MDSSGSPPSARWPFRLQELVTRLQDAETGSLEALRGEIWLVLFTVIAGYARVHALKLGRLPEPEISDLVSQKALDLLTRVDLHEWDPSRESEGRIRAFLSTVSRNGVIDRLRSNARVSSMPEPEELAMDEAYESFRAKRDIPPSDKVEVVEFVENLRGCVEKLTPPARKLWFFRVLYEMPSKWIARHPEIQMTVGNVDVALQRCRKAIAECMGKRGMKLHSLPPGTFAALWESCIRDNGPLSKEGEGA